MNISSPDRYRISLQRLAALAVGILLLAIVLEITMTSVDRQPLTPIQFRAYQRIATAQAALYEYRGNIITEEHQQELEKSDTPHSGLIGLEWSHLVTTPGSYDAKILSCDPRWGVLLCDWYERAGVTPGTVVAIGSSGSFPALMVAARIAAESMGARPRVAGSLTSSNFGATIPEFDLYAIDQYLADRKLFDNPMTLLTPGGEEDRLYGFADEDRELIENRLAEIARSQNATQVLLPQTLEESIDVRSDRLFQDPSPAVFVNIGGNSANYGVGAVALALPPGYVDPNSFPGAVPEGDSVALRALARDIPVINLINLRNIALENTDYFVRGDGDSESYLAQNKWTTTQRILALSIAVATLAGCILMRQHNP